MGKRILRLISFLRSSFEYFTKTHDEQYDKDDCIDFVLERNKEEIKANQDYVNRTFVSFVLEGIRRRKAKIKSVNQLILTTPDGRAFLLVDYFVLPQERRIYYLRANDKNWEEYLRVIDRLATFMVKHRASMHRLYERILQPIFMEFSHLDIDTEHALKIAVERNLLCEIPKKKPGREEGDEGIAGAEVV